MKSKMPLVLVGLSCLVVALAAADIKAYNGFFIREGPPISANPTKFGPSGSGSTENHTCWLLASGGVPRLDCNAGDNNLQLRTVFTDQRLVSGWPGPTALSVAIADAPTANYGSIYSLKIDSANKYDPATATKVIEVAKQYNGLPGIVMRTSHISQNAKGNRSFALIESGGKTFVTEVTEGGFNILADLSGDFSRYFKETPEQRRLLVTSKNVIVVVSERSASDVQVFLVNADGVPFVYSGQPVMEFVQTLGPKLGQQEFGTPLDLSGGNFYIDHFDRLDWIHKFNGSTTLLKGTAFAIPPDSGSPIEVLGQNTLGVAASLGRLTINSRMKVVALNLADDPSNTSLAVNQYANTNGLPWSRGMVIGDKMPGGEVLEGLSPFTGSISSCGTSVLSRKSNGAPSKIYGIFAPSPTSLSQVGNELNITGDCFYFPEFVGHTVVNVLWWGFNFADAVAGKNFEYPSVSPSAGSPGKVSFPVKPEWVAHDVYLFYVVAVDGVFANSPAMLFNFATPDRPQIAAVVNGATFKATSLSPGAWISIFGQNLGQAAAWNGDPNMFSLGGASVTVCGIPATLSLNSGPTPTGWQVNAIMPDGVAGQEVCPVLLTVNGVDSQPVNVAISSGMEELFSYNLGGSGLLPVLTHQDYSLVGPGIAGFVPAKPGEPLIAWGTGECSNPTLMVGGKAAQILFAGRVAPGLCQTNFVVPDDVSGNTTLTIPPDPTNYILTVSQ